MTENTNKASIDVSDSAVTKLFGKKFVVDFGAKAILEIRNVTEMTFHITEIDGKKMDETETVAINITALREDLFMLTWKERNGNTVTQIQDHCHQTVYMNWTLPDGEFRHARGTLSA